MRKDNKKDIFEVYDMLCRKYPSWHRNKDLPTFQTLFLCWRATELRHHVHSPVFYTDSWNRKWLPKADFERFKAYALQ